MKIFATVLENAWQSFLQCEMQYNIGKPIETIF